MNVDVVYMLDCGLALHFKGVVCLPAVWGGCIAYYVPYYMTYLVTHCSFCFSFFTTTTTTTTTTTIMMMMIRHGTGMNTGIDLEALVDAGDYVCRLLKRENQSKVARGSRDLATSTRQHYLNSKVPRQYSIHHVHIYIHHVHFIYARIGRQCEHTQMGS